MLSAERPEEPRLNDRESPPPRGALRIARLESPPRGALLNDRDEPPPPPRGALLNDRPPPPRPPPLNDRLEPPPRCPPLERMPPPPPPPRPPLIDDRPPPSPPRPPPPRPPPPRSPRCANASPATSTDANSATSDHRLPKLENDIAQCLPTGGRLRSPALVVLCLSDLSQRPTTRSRQPGAMSIGHNISPERIIRRETDTQPPCRC
jgi:hypothetical protein